MRPQAAGDAEPRRELSRRNLLWLGVTTAALGLASCGRSAGGSVLNSQAIPDESPRLPSAAAATPTAPLPSSPSIEAVRPAPIVRRAAHPTIPPPPPGQHAPVRSLADYVRQLPGTHPFASDAVMLTIDDGPHPLWTPRILRLLHRYGVKATFFVIGQQAAAHPDLVRAIVREGHHVANHTFSHPIGLPAMPAARIERQVVDAQDAIVRATGVTPHQFRSPGGSWSPALMRATAKHRLTAIDWDIDPRDWSRPGTPQIIRAMLAARAGDILLCHDGGGDRSQTYAALATVLPRLKARGLEFITFPAPPT